MPRLMRLAAAMIAALVALPAVATQPDALEEVRVHLIAVRKPVLAAELAGRVTAVDFRAGQAFASGDILLAFDCALHEAREARALAQRNRVQRQLASLRQLDRSGATSRLELDIALADLAGAEAELRQTQITVQRCRIPAPFPGRVVEQRVQPGEYVTEGQPVLEIIDDSELEFESIVPSHWLTWLREGVPFEAELHEVGAPIRARVTRIAPLIDPVSQTVKVYARAEPGSRPVMAGMSGIARFERPAANQDR